MGKSLPTLRVTISRPEASGRKDKTAIEAELRDTSKVSCDKTQRVYAEAKIEEAAILETFTFDANDTENGLSGLSDNTNLDSQGKALVKATISIPVSAKWSGE